MIEVLGGGSRWRKWLDYDVEMAAARQAQLLGFRLGFSVAKELRSMLRQLPFRELDEQVVFNAAAG